MIRRGLLVGVVAVAGLIVTPVASANQARLGHLRPIAEQTFPAALDNCYAGITIRTGGLHYGSADSAAEAWDPTDTRQPGYCEVRLREGWEGWFRETLCRRLVHEFGHLAGLRHSADPTDVMFPGSDPAVVPECAAIEAAGDQLVIKQARLSEASELLAETRALRRAAEGRKKRNALRKRLVRLRERVSVLQERVAWLHAVLGP